MLLKIAVNAGLPPCQGWLVTTYVGPGLRTCEGITKLFGWAHSPPREEGNAPNRHIVNSFTRLPARHKLPARRAGIGTLARGLVGIERHSCRIGVADPTKLSF